MEWKRILKKDNNMLKIIYQMNVGGAFQKKLVGQNGSLTRCSAGSRHKNNNLIAGMSTIVTVLHDYGE